MTTAITTAREEELALLFTEGRTHNGWLDKPIDDALLHRLYELTRMGPTMANSHPLRVLFVKSSDAKEKLRPTLAPFNVDKTMSAPTTAIIAYDAAFYEKMPKLFPARPEMGEALKGMPEPARSQGAERSAMLAAGYLILAARALGLDCGPMAGFDADAIDTTFFAGSTWKSLILINLGYGDKEKLWPRNPRLDFDEACKIA